jgi:hypothetical protein
VDFGEVPYNKKSITTTQMKFPKGLPPGNDPPKPRLHGDSSSFGLVYANELASKAYSASPIKPFPVGSILIREKLATRFAEKPQMLTVMIKREKGFNPEGGDWSFLTIDGAATKVKQRKKKGDCLECHQSASARDFVFELK